MVLGWQALATTGEARPLPVPRNAVHMMPRGDAAIANTPPPGSSGSLGPDLALVPEPECAGTCAHSRFAVFAPCFSP